MSRASCLVVLVAALTAPAAAGAQTASGLAPLAGRAGCVAAPGTDSDGCSKAGGLLGVGAVVLSPDEADLYVIAGGPDDEGYANGVTAFRRDPATGGLRPNGCVTDTGDDGRVGSDGACEDGDALGGAVAAAFSPDGSTLYVAARRAAGLSVLRRDPATGKLTQAGCFSTPSRGSRCAPVPALNGADDVAVSPDGRSVYTTSADRGVVSTFSRDPATGALAYTGCVSDTGLDGTCEDGQALRGAFVVTVSPDGATVYTLASAGAVASFKRDAATGALAPAACFVAGAPKAGRCADVPALAGADALALSPDGAFLYVGATNGAVDADATLTVMRTGATAGRLSRVVCYANAPPAGDDVEYDYPDGDGPEGGSRRSGGAHCAGVRRLEGTGALALSADGRALIAVSTFGFATLRRDPGDGTLAPTGCAENVGDYRSCVNDRDLTAVNGVAVSADGGFAYFSAGDRVIGYGAAVAVSAGRRLAAHSRVRVTLRCPRVRRSGCSGALSARVPGDARARTALRPPVRQYRLRAGGRRRMTVRLAGVRRRARRLRVQVRATDARHVVRATTVQVVVRR